MAQANIGSRRACEKLIEQGRVRVNGEVITLGTQADPETDVILVDGEKLNFTNIRKVYIALNKPRNVVSTNKRHHGETRKTVRELVPVEGHLFTIGRLDAESEGLIILTNDGELAQQVSHPSFRHTKTYKVIVYGLPTAEEIKQWEAGVMLDDETQTAPCSAQITKGGKETTTLRIIMTEGKKRQIRRVAAKLGHPVKRLVRTHIGQLNLGPLEAGDWRELTERDLDHLRKPAVDAPAFGKTNYKPSRHRRRPTGPASRKLRSPRNFKKR
jgi:pseudouridine synthase